MKVLQISTPFLPISPNLGYSGTERGVYLLDRELNSQGNSAGVVAPNGSKPASKLYPTILKPLGEGFVLDSDSSSSKSEGVYSRLDHIAKAVEYANSVSDADIIHIHDDNMLAFENQIKKPCLMTLHTYYQAFWNPELHLFIRNLKTKLVAMSQSQKRLYESRGIPIDYLVYYGIDQDLFQIGEKHPFVLNIGNFHPMKGQKEVISAGINAGLDVVLAGTIGDPDYFKREIQPKITHNLSQIKDKYQHFSDTQNSYRRKEDSRRVFYLGEVNDSQKKPFYSSAKAYLMPITVEEPFGQVMVEAMMSGTPIIAFNRGSVPEIVEEGKTGFIVANLEQMIEAIANASKINPEECRRIAIHKFRKENMIDNYLQVYQDILSKSKPI